jgi:DDE domain
MVTKIVTDRLCSFCAATKEIGNADRHEVGRRLNNRAENSHQPFRRRERAMQRFRSTKTLQKFSSVHAEVHNHFNQTADLKSATALLGPNRRAPGDPSPGREGAQRAARRNNIAYAPHSPGQRSLS